LTIEFQGALPLPFDQGLEYLAVHPNLKFLRLNLTDEEIAREVELEALKQAAPHLVIFQGDKRLGGPDDVPLPEYPDYVDFLPETVGNKRNGGTQG
jgi:hypothetical protein